MTTIASTGSTLSSLAALYAKEDAGASTSGETTSKAGILTKDQVENLVGIAENGASGSADTLSTLLGQSTTSPGDLSSIIDAIQAQTANGASEVTSGATTNTSATTDQQKAAAMMQSIYQTQQANLFTLLG